MFKLPTFSIFILLGTLKVSFLGKNLHLILSVALTLNKKLQLFTVLAILRKDFTCFAKKFGFLRNDTLKFWTCQKLLRSQLFVYVKQERLNLFIIRIFLKMIHNPKSQDTVNELYHTWKHITFFLINSISLAQQQRLQSKIILRKGKNLRNADTNGYS